MYGTLEEFGIGVVRPADSIETLCGQGANASASVADKYGASCLARCWLCSAHFREKFSLQHNHDRLVATRACAVQPRRWPAVRTA